MATIQTNVVATNIGRLLVQVKNTDTHIHTHPHKGDVLYNFRYRFTIKYASKLFRYRTKEKCKQQLKASKAMNNSSEGGAKLENYYYCGTHNSALREPYCPKKGCQKHHRMVLCVVVLGLSENTRNLEHAARLYSMSLQPKSGVGTAYCLVGRRHC